MTDFLVAVSLGSDHDQDTRGVRRLLDATAGGYAPFVGTDYDPVPHVLHPSSASAALVFTRRGSAAQPLEPRGDRWVVTAGDDAAREIHDAVRLRAGRLVYETPVWGSYASVLVERWTGRVTAWNTVPAFEAVHWAQDRRHVYLSNRPLLIALALAGGRRSSVALSPDYLAEYLTYGYSMTGQSPFTGVQILPADRALRVAPGRVEEIDVPAGLAHPLRAEHTLDEGAEALAEAMRAAGDRSECRLDGRPLQLRASGGMDSRVLMGLMRDRGLPVTALTYGQPTDLDVRIGALLAARAGLEFRMASPTLAAGETIEDQLLSTLRRSRGLPPSEAHTGRYLGADVSTPGQAVMLGQWPLYKGGAAKRLRYAEGEARVQVLKAGSTAVRPQVKAPLDSWLGHWFDTAVSNNQVETLYQFSRQFRSGRWMQAHISLYSGDAMPVYPLGDAEVTAVADALTMSEKVSHRAAFGALSRIWPEGTAVPLDGKAWKFEIAGPDPNWSGPHYADRMRPLDPYVSPGSPVSASQPNEHSDATAASLVRGLVRSDGFDVMATLLADDWLSALTETAERGQSVVPAGESLRSYRKMLWRIRTADLWWGGTWLRA